MPPCAAGAPNSGPGDALVVNNEQETSSLRSELSRHTERSASIRVIRGAVSFAVHSLFDSALFLLIMACEMLIPP